MATSEVTATSAPKRFLRLQESRDRLEAAGFEPLESNQHAEDGAADEAESLVDSATASTSHAHNSRASSPLQGYSTSSLPAGSEHGTDDGLWGDLDDDDLETGLRRYHLPSETDSSQYSSQQQSHSLLGRLLASMQELRVSARQRRAARLLTMPSEQFPYKLQACLITWLCDATDRGIMLVAACLIVWMVLGTLFSMDAWWWLTGVGLFLVRISARRLYEASPNLYRYTHVVLTSSNSQPTMTPASSTTPDPIQRRRSASRVELASITYPSSTEGGTLT